MSFAGSAVPWDPQQIRDAAQAAYFDEGAASTMLSAGTPYKGPQCRAAEVAVAGAPSLPASHNKVFETVQKCVDAGVQIITNVTDLAAVLPRGPKVPSQVVSKKQGVNNQPGNNESTSFLAGLDPINPATGDFYIYRSDLALPARGVSFEMKRAYHSRLEFNGPLGFGWEHNYSQRLVPTNTDCEGELVYAMGLGSTMSFAKAAESALEVTYEPEQPVHFSLRGRKTTAGDILSWQVVHPDGLTLDFDNRGLLIRIEDSSLLGLDVYWEPAPEPANWRLEHVTDAAGRQIKFTYGGDGRLSMVHEPTSKLTATYTYDANGDLREVTDGFGRKESYEYENPTGSIEPDIGQPKPVPERQLRDACELLCAPAGTSCHAAGLCDDAAVAFEQECNSLMFDCADGCKAECESRILITTGDKHALAVQECLNASDGGEDCSDFNGEYLAFCQASTTMDGFSNQCASLAIAESQNCQSSCTTPVPLPTGDLCGQQCNNDAACADGQWCNTIGRCQCSFFEECPSSGRCPEYESACAFSSGIKCSDVCGNDENCWTQCFDLTEPACNANCPVGCQAGLWDGCMVGLQSTCPSAARDDCVEACTADTAVACTNECILNADWGCDPINWSAEHCAGVDWNNICREGCETACVEEGRGWSGAPIYGELTDLKHNLIVIRDGEGRPYLTNHYGQDPKRPDFDSVYSQTMAGATTGVYYRDLLAEQENPALVPNDDSKKYVVGRDAYEPVEICPTFCAQRPFFADLSDFVPWNGNLLVVKSAGSVGGIPASQATHMLAPTLLTFTQQGAQAVGAVTLPIGLRFVVTTNAGPVTFATSGPPGRFMLTGSSNAIDTIKKFGQLTVVTETPSGILRAYRGAPRGLLHVSAGSCTRTFQATQNALDEVVIAPSTACTANLEFAPLASVLDGAGYASDYQLHGKTAFNGIDLFAPVIPVSGRHTISLTSPASTPGRYLPAVGSLEGRAPRSLAGAASTAASVAPLFSAPSPTESLNLANRPLYVFHVPAAIRPTDWVANGPLFDSGNGFKPEDFDEVNCTGLLGAARRDLGPRPASATVVIDAYGIPWTFYYDEEGRHLRTVNDSTKAERSFNYDSYGNVTAVEQPLRDRICAAYDAQGNVAKVTRFPVPNAMGPTAPIIHRFEYQPAPARPTKVYDPRDPASLLASYEWTPDGHLKSARNAMGQVTLYDNLTSWGAPRTITGHDGTVTTIVYDEVTALPTNTTVQGNGTAPVTTSVSYDSAGRPKTSYGALGGETKFAWSQDRSVTTQEPGPYLTAISHGGGGLQTTTSLSYDRNGQVVLSGNELSSISTKHDDFGWPRRVEAKAIIGGPTIPSVHCRRYGANGRLLEEIEPEGARSRYKYDGEGRLLAVESGYFYPDTFSAWDDDCPIRTPTQPGFVSAELSRTHYDLNGRPYLFTDARGATTSVTYDGFGRPIMAVDPDGDQRHVAYDAIGNALWVASYRAAPDNIIAYQLPLAGDPKLLALAEFGYDAKGRTTSISRWHFDENGSSVGDGRSTTTYLYDDQLRKLTTVDDAGQATIQTFDGVGRPTSTFYPTGDNETFVYSSGGKVVQHHRSAPTANFIVGSRTVFNEWGAPVRTEADMGANWPVLEEWQYDQWLRLSKTMGPSGVPTPALGQRYEETFGYDGFSRVSSQLRRFGDTSQESLAFVYDRNGRLTQHKSKASSSQADATTTYHYDAIARLTRIDRPEGLWEAYAYEGASPLPSTRTDPRLVSIGYSYFASGALKRIGAGGADMSKWLYRDFTYDGLGRVTEARDSGTSNAITSDDVVTWFKWDSLGGKRQEWNSLLGPAQGVAHALDGRGLPAQSTLGPVTLRRAFDELGRMTDLYFGTSTTAAVHFGFDGLGGPTSRSYANGVATTYHYDGLGRLDAQTDMRGSTQVAKWQWAIPLDGLPRAATMWRGTTPLTSFYKADMGSRLVAEDHGVAVVPALGISPITPTVEANTKIASYLHTGKGPTSTGGYGTGAPGTAWRDYSLDGRSNWLSRTGGTSSLNVSPTLNLLDAYKTFGVPATYDVDATLKTLGTAESYTYNAFGEVIQIQVGSGASSKTKRFEYDALGRRVSERLIGTTVTQPVLYGYDGVRRTLRKFAWQTAAEVTVDGDGLDEHLIVVSADQTQTKRFYHQERGNSVYLVTDAAGSPAEWYQYSAYGDMTILSPAAAPLFISAFDNRFGYQGQAFDAAFGLVDMRARFYRPAWGRFVTPDPIGLAGGSNLYAFVGSSPTGYWDPLGTDRKNFTLGQAQLRVAQGFTFDAFSQPEPSQFTQWMAKTSRAFGGNAAFAMAQAPNTELAVKTSYADDGVRGVFNDNFNPIFQMLAGQHDMRNGSEVAGGLKLVGGIAGVFGLKAGVGAFTSGKGGGVLPGGGFLDDAADSAVDLDGAWVRYDELDSLGRPTGAHANITPELIGTGSPANRTIQPPGFITGKGGARARGHLLGDQLGGSGDDPRNLVTMQQTPANSPNMRDFETSVRQAVEAGENVRYSVTPIYKHTGRIPVGLTLKARGSNGFSLDVTILNPPGMAGGW